MNKFIYWAPRILSIMLSLFLVVFSFDIVEPGLILGQIAVGLLIHNIPSLVLLTISIISFKHELFGAIAFMLSGLAFICLMLVSGSLEDLLYSFPFITAPAFIIGILYFVNWKRKVRT